MNHFNNILICSDELKLNALTLDISEELFNIVNENQDYFKKFDFIAPYFKSVEETKLEITRLITHEKNTGAITYQLLHNKKTIGLVKVNSVDWSMKNANIGYWLTEAASKKGFAKLALLTLIQELHNKKIHTITAHTATTNTSSQKLLLAVGFKLNKTLKQNVIINWKAVDDSEYILINVPK